MSDQPTSKRQCTRPPRRYPWCDGKFRCVRCPKAMGRDGRGYSRARDVPCTDPDTHLTVSDRDNCDQYWLSDPNAVHFDLTVGRDLNRSVGDVAKPGPDGWCIACDPHNRYANGRLQAPSRTIPLDAHVSTWPELWDKTDAVLRLDPTTPPKRARKIQLPWCDGLYRCIHCAPQGQMRPVGSKQCTDPMAHMPTGTRGHFVHFLSTNTEDNVLRSGDRELLEMFAMRVNGCGRCATDGLGCPPCSQLTRWGGC
jgi:hypothetical protein|eukprot:COSAG06_NODE_800_length_12197_cov_9.094974_9_plen_253_part_00